MGYNTILVSEIDADIYTDPLDIYDQIWDADETHMVAISFTLGFLHTNAATISITIKVGQVIINGQSGTRFKPAGVTSVHYQVAPILIHQNARLTISIQSDNSEDANDAASSDTYLHNSQQIDVRYINAADTPVDGLEATYDGTGYVDGKAPATQEQIGNISTGSAPINTTADGVAASTPTVVGTPTNTYADTKQENGTYHSWVPAGGELEFAYDFNIGSNTSPTSTSWVGYVQGNNDLVRAYARNWVGTSWEQVGPAIVGTPLATEQRLSFELTTAHVDTGANSGNVRIRFVSTGGDIMVVFATDRILCGYTVVNQSVGYANGAIWIDTNVTNENTVAFVDGVADNPVSTLAAALSLSGSTGLKRFEVATQSDMDFEQDMTGYVFNGYDYDIDMAGFNSDSLVLIGAKVSGLLTSSGAPGLIRCRLSDGCTLPSGGYDDCILPGDITLPGTFYMFEQCKSAVAGTGAPSFTLTSGDTVNLNFRDCSGGIHVEGLEAGGNMSLEGRGQLIIGSTCSGGTIAIRGHYTITDNVAGGFVAGGGVISDDARYDTGQVNAEVVDALSVDTYAEPGQGTPASTTSLAAKIGYLFKAWRNKSDQTVTTWQLYNDDAATVDQKATVDDDNTTASKTEIISGP
jgi:hypothetical protein